MTRAQVKECEKPNIKVCINNASVIPRGFCILIAEKIKSTNQSYIINNSKIPF